MQVNVLINDTGKSEPVVLKAKLVKIKNTINVAPTAQELSEGLAKIFKDNIEKPNSIVLAGGIALGLYDNLIKEIWLSYTQSNDSLADDIFASAERENMLSFPLGTDLTDKIESLIDLDFNGSYFKEVWLPNPFHTFKNFLLEFYPSDYEIFKEYCLKN